MVPRNQPVQRVSVGPLKRLGQESVAIATLKYTYYLLKGSLDSAQETRVEEPEPVVEPESWKLLSALFGELRERCGVDAAAALPVRATRGVAGGRNCWKRGRSVLSRFAPGVFEAGCDFIEARLRRE